MDQYHNSVLSGKRPALDSEMFKRLSILDKYHYNIPVDLVMVQMITRVSDSWYDKNKVCSWGEVLADMSVLFGLRIKSYVTEANTGKQLGCWTSLNIGLNIFTLCIIHKVASTPFCWIPSFALEERVDLWMTRKLWWAHHFLHPSLMLSCSLQAYLQLSSTLTILSWYTFTIILLSARISAASLPTSICPDIHSKMFMLVLPSARIPAASLLGGFLHFHYLRLGS
jgi:hypothetical protein